MTSAWTKSCASRFKKKKNKEVRAQVSNPAVLISTTDYIRPLRARVCVCTGWWVVGGGWRLGGGDVIYTASGEPFMTMMWKRHDSTLT